MIYNFLTEYLSIIIFLFLALFLSVGFILANFLAAPSNPDPEKLSAYECGFEPFDDSRMEFDVRFYLVAILYYIRFRNCISFSLGYFLRRNRFNRFLVDDVFFRSIDYRIYL